MHGSIGSDFSFIPLFTWELLQQHSSKRAIGRFQELTATTSLPYLQHALHLILGVAVSISCCALGIAGSVGVAAGCVSEEPTPPAELPGNYSHEACTVNTS